MSPAAGQPQVPGPATVARNVSRRADCLGRDSPTRASCQRAAQRLELRASAAGDVGCQPY